MPVITDSHGARYSISFTTFSAFLDRDLPRNTRAMVLPGQISLQPMDRDEPRFAQASKQMLESGDLVDIRFQGEARHKKPVGIYWAQAAAVEKVWAVVLA